MFSSTGEALEQSFVTIQFKQTNSSAALRSQANYPLSFVSEMLCPDLRPRVEEWTELSGLRV